MMFFLQPVFFFVVCVALYTGLQLAPACVIGRGSGYIAVAVTVISTRAQLYNSFGIAVSVITTTVVMITKALI